jgi:hypothetical protein
MKKDSRIKEVPKVAAKYRRLIAHGFKAARLAHTYIEDGALRSGARCLREAADRQTQPRTI